MYKRVKLWYLLWLLPVYLLGMNLHMFAIYTGLSKTYENGRSYLADVVHFEIKQIAAQTNGSITVRFTPDGEPEITRRLSQPIQNAAQLQASQIMPIRYLADSYQPIVLVPIYEFHKKMVLVNMAMLTVAFLLALAAALTAHRHVRRVLSGETQTTTSFEIAGNRPPAH